MKISEMSIKDRFDDLMDKVIAMRSELEDDEYTTDTVNLQMRNDLTVLFGRLRKLRDYVLKEIANR